MGEHRLGRVRLVAGALLWTLVGVVPSAGATPDPNPPGGFAESTVVGGSGELSSPTAARFAPDGRIFVAEKRGTIKVFDGPGDSTPAIFADLRTEVFNFMDRGLLGLEIDPDFPTRPYLYALYSRDAPIGGSAPTWGGTGDGDPCPDPPGLNVDGCVTSGRLVRLTAAWDAGQTTWLMTGEPTVLVDDWCNQFATHSVGTVMFGPDGALYVGGGDGASATFPDIGQRGWPSPENLNPCGDPPGGVGTALSPPTSEGGALRSQDARTPADPQALNGTIARIDPDTGAGLPDNPWAADADPNRRRVVAYGLRNPYRFAFRPGAATPELWLGDVGNAKHEEINRLHEMTTEVENFGWPCYEGPDRLSTFDAMNLDLCEGIYAELGATQPPYWYYDHDVGVVPGESCSSSSSAISGVAFYEGGDYPDEYDGALFFADYSRSCIWVMFPGADGLPDPTTRRTFRSSAVTPVELQVGPDGDLYYVDIWLGRLARITYQPGTPTARFTTDATYGPLPLTVAFDAGTSSDPEGGPLSYEWDLDGDGAYDDSTSPTPSRTYTERAVVQVGLRVTDGEGKSDTTGTTLWPGDSPPTVTITAPTWHETPEGPVADSPWAVGDTVAYAGSATDAEDGPLAGTELTWDLRLRECEEGSCHTHPLLTHSGDGGSIVVPEPDHDAVLEIALSAADSAGLTDEKVLRLDPSTIDLTVTSSPAGLTLTLGSETGPAPLTEEVIVGSNHSIDAPSPQTLEGNGYTFTAWSDGGAAFHNVTAPDSPLTLTATFDGPPPASPEITITGEATPETAGSQADFVVSLSHPSGDPVTVGFATADGSATAGSDYTAAGGTVQFTPGDTTETVPVDVLGDAIDETDETFELVLTNPVGGRLADARADSVITDDDAPPVVVPQWVTTTETAGGSQAQSTALLTDASGAPITSGKPVTVSYQTYDWTAQAPGDFTTTSGTLTFWPGESSKAAPVTVNDDAIDEDTEHLVVRWHSPVNARMGGIWGLGFVEITDDDPPPVVVPQMVTVTETAGDAQLQVLLTDAADQPISSAKTVSVPYETYDFTAQAPGDYTATSGTLTFDPGESSQTVAVTVNNDGIAESTEHLLVRFHDPVNARMGGIWGLGIVAITDDDG